MGSRNSTTKYRAGPGFFLDKNGCVVDVCGVSCNPCNPCNPCMPQFNPCNPCLPQFNPCAPCPPCPPCQPCQPCSPYSFNQFPYACGQPCCEPEMLNIYARDCEPPQLNIYNYTYEKPCDPYFFNSSNQCFPTFSNRYIQPCFQKQYAQVSMNPFQAQCESVCDLPYIQPFVQSFQNYVPQRCDTPVFPPLAMPAVLPNAQQFLNPFATFCSQNYFPAPSFQPNFQSQFQQLPQFQPQQLNFPPPPPPPCPQSFQPPCSQGFQPPCSQGFQPPQNFQPPCPQSFPPPCQPFQPPCQQFQPCPPSFPQSCPTSCRPPCSLPIAMPYSFPQQLPQLPNFQNCFQNPLLEHFAQLSARPCNFGYQNPWI